MWTKAAYTLIIILALIQLIPVEKENPAAPADQFVEFPHDVGAIVKKACADCHTFKTQWPWYSYVAPVSWIVANHVVEGREELNFSVWQSYSDKDKAHKLKDIVEEVEKGKMPLFPYTITHPQASLTQDEVQTLLNWVKSDSLFPGAAH